MKWQSPNWQQRFFFFAFRVFKVASRVCKVISRSARNSLSNARMLYFPEEVIPILQASVLFHAQPWHLPCGQSLQGPTIRNSPQPSQKGVPRDPKQVTCKKEARS